MSQPSPQLLSRFLVFLFAGIKCSNYGPVDFNAKEIGKSSRLFESTLTYKCKTGWRKTSGNGTRLCLSDGNWTGRPLVCESKFIVTDRIRSVTGGYVFTGVCLFRGGGVPRPSPDGERGTPARS